jgi:hypothetical protein
MRRLLSLVAALAVAACAATPPKIEENDPPEPGYRDDLLKHIHGQLADPTGIRDAFITEPALRPVQGNTMRQVVCVRFNPRDERGRYLGNVEMAAIFHSRAMNSFTRAPDGVCASAAYQPWPELTKLCREIVCPGRR